jgi:hypothetical protein
MPYNLIAILVSAAIASLVGILAVATPAHGSRLWLRRLALPFLWIASREPRSKYAEFSRRASSKREFLLTVWLPAFAIAPVLLEMTHRHFDTII